MDISFNTQTSPAYQQKIQTWAMIYLQHISVFFLLQSQKKKITIMHLFLYFAA